MSDEQRNDDLIAFEQQLRTSEPRPARLDRDRLMFLAGQTAASHVGSKGRAWRAWCWPLATACSLLLAAFFAWRGASMSPVRIVERVVYQPAPSPQTGEADWGPSSSDELPDRTASAAEAMVATPRATDTNEVRLARSNPWWNGATRARSGYLGNRDLAVRFGIDAIPLTLTSHEPGVGNETPSRRPATVHSMTQDLLETAEKDRG